MVSYLGDHLPDASRAMELTNDATRPSNNLHSANGDPMSGERRRLCRSLPPYPLKSRTCRNDGYNIRRYPPFDSANTAHPQTATARTLLPIQFSKPNPAFPIAPPNPPPAASSMGGLSTWAVLNRHEGSKIVLRPTSKNLHRSRHSSMGHSAGKRTKMSGDFEDHGLSLHQRAWRLHSLRLDRGNWLFQYLHTPTRPAAALIKSSNNSTRMRSAVSDLSGQRTRRTSLKDFVLPDIHAYHSAIVRIATARERHADGPSTLRFRQHRTRHCKPTGAGRHSTKRTGCATAVSRR